MTITVHVSDALASADPAAVLVTYALGSCIGVCLHDPLARVGGLLHYQLPTSTMDAAKARQKPAMFADTGMALLLAEMERLGAHRSRLKVRLAGGANMLNDAASMSIGKRNHAAIRKILWQLGLFVESEDVGGSTPRTVYLAVANGGYTLKSGGMTVAT